MSGRNSLRVPVLTLNTLSKILYLHVKEFCYNRGMTSRKIKSQGKNTDVNGEGNEKTDNTSSSVTDVITYSLQDDNPKIAGMAAGYREATKTK